MSDAFIQTVRGPIAPGELGQTLMHDHLLDDVTRTASIRPVKAIVEGLRRAEEVGIGGLVDPGTEQYGAVPLIFALVAEQTPIHIIAATGLYSPDHLPLPAWAYPPATSEEIAEHLVWAAVQGIEGSGVKPGVIKVATAGRAIGEAEEAILRAAALAQRQTGLAITTHTQLTRFAEQQVDIFEEAGADLDRVVIGHIGWGSGVEDFPLHERLVKRGVTIGLDFVGQEQYRSTTDYARMVLDLVEAGYASQIVLSHDTRLAEGGDVTVIHRRLLPLLLDGGMPESVFETIMVENPRRVLSIDPDRYRGASAAFDASDTVATASG